MVPVVQPPLGAAISGPGPGRTARSRSGPLGIALVALLEPRVAAVVVAVLLPEPRAISLHELQPGDPFRGLPEVQVRHEEPDRAAVADRQGSAVDLPHHPRPATG